MKNMKYFLVKTETKNNPVPEIVNWFKQIDMRDLCPERAGNIPDWLTFDMKSAQDAVLPDIFSSYGFLLSEMAYEVLRMYDPYLGCKRAALVDSSSGLSFMCFLPILPVYACLLPESEFNRGKSRVIHGVMNPGLASNVPVFRLGGVTDFQAVVRLDVIESLLRRGAKCLKLTELVIKE